jgi:hypothetical protein
MDLQINQHARLQIGAEVFGSVISGRHEKNATILARWKAINDESVDIYPGEVRKINFELSLAILYCMRESYIASKTRDTLYIINYVIQKSITRLCNLSCYTKI